MLIQDIIPNKKKIKQIKKTRNKSLKSFSVSNCHPERVERVEKSRVYARKTLVESKAFMNSGLPRWLHCGGALWSLFAKRLCIIFFEITKGSTALKGLWSQRKFHFQRKLSASILTLLIILQTIIGIFTPINISVTPPYISNQQAQAVLIDDFNRTDNADVGNNWELVSGGTDQWDIYNNQLRVQDPGHYNEKGLLRPVSEAAENVQVSVDFNKLSAFHSCPQVWLRTTDADTSPTTYIFFINQSGVNEFQAIRLNNGVWTTIGIGANVCEDNHYYRFVATAQNNGNQVDLTLKVLDLEDNNNEIFNQTWNDTAANRILGSGRQGLSGQFHTILYDNFDIVDLSSEAVISSYTPSKTLQIQDERGASYKQSYPYFQKSKTLDASATLNSTNGVGGVRFIVDQGEANEIIINDTNTSDTSFSTQFTSLAYGSHTLDIIILDSSLTPLSGINQTIEIDPFWIVRHIAQFVGDSITISYSDDTNGPVYDIGDALTDGNAVTNNNQLELPCHDAQGSDYSNGIHIPFSDYANSNHSAYIFSNNEAQSGITASGTHTKFINNANGFTDRFTSLDENDSNASLYGPTHAFVML
jgi:hypothetical protein